MQTFDYQRGEGYHPQSKLLSYNHGKTSGEPTFRNYYFTPLNPTSPRIPDTPAERTPLANVILVL